MDIEKQRARNRAAQKRFRENNPERTAEINRKDWDKNGKARYEKHAGYYKMKAKENRDNPDKDWRAVNPLRYALNRARDRSKRYNIEFTITLDDLGDLPTHCPIFGIPLIGVSHTPAEKNNVVSIDRIDPNKGYIPGNVKIISWLANRMKNNMTIDIMKKFIEVYGD